jgi:glucokinase
MKVIGVDLGATNIRGAVVTDGALGEIVSTRIHSDGSVGEVLDDIYQVIDGLIDPEVVAIGIGVPSVVDVEQGIVYDVLYIPSWVEVPLKKILEDRYGKLVFVNNDANCFALGEYHFGKGKDMGAGQDTGTRQDTGRQGPGGRQGKGTGSMIGLPIGTGLGCGIIIHQKLFAGYNCGAGEIGLLPYKDNILEYYCSGSFFRNVYGLDGVEVYQAALDGDARAIALYGELGVHVGQAIKAVTYAYDPELIVLGGSVSQAFPLFREAMWKEVGTLVYAKTLERMRVEVSGLKNSGILGAAALYYDSI